MSPMSHLADDTLFAFVQGELSGDALASADAHIDSCPSCRELVAEVIKLQPSAVDATLDPGSAATVASGPESPADGTTPELRRGSVVGRYVILDLLGQGAMGLVYAAFDTDLNRKVALKLLRPDRASAPVRERLLREAQALAKLSVPNVVSVYEVGTVGEAIFLAMEYVEGGTLADWIAAGPHPWRTVLDRFIQAGRGLQAAHATGLVHRDFKPANVLVPADGQVRVTDFGLARAEHEAPGSQAPAPVGGSVDRLATDMTAAGTLIGTPAYMAPEQLDAKPADAHSDQFSFCVTLYEALYGARPFAGSSVAALRKKIAAGVPTVKSGRSVPAWLRHAVLRGLADKPEDRFPNMAALLTELTRDHGQLWRRLAVGAAFIVPLGFVAALILAPRPTPPKPCTTARTELGKVWNEARKVEVGRAIRRANPTYGGKVAKTVLAGLHEWGEQWVDAHQSTCRATRIAKTQSEKLLDVRMACLRRQRATADALVAELVRIDSAGVAGAPAAVTALPRPRACADTVSLTSVESPRPDQQKSLDEWRVGYDRARALLHTGKTEKGHARAQAVLVRAQQIGYRPAVAAARRLLAEAWLQKGATTEAGHEAYAALWKAQAARDDRGVADAWLLLARIAGEGARYDRARHLIEHARAAVTRIGSPAPLRATLHSRLGLIFFNRGDYAAAEREIRRGLAVRRTLHWSRNYEVASSYTALGHLARVRRRYEEALGFHRRALAIDKANFGTHPRLARHQHNLGGIFRAQGKHRAALPHYRAALKLKTKLLGARHPETGLTHNSLGIVHYELGDLPTAKQHYDRALAIFAAAEHPQRALALHNLGLLHARKKETAQAVSHLQRALAIYTQVHGPAHERTARASLELGDLLLADAMAKIPKPAAPLRRPGTRPRPFRRPPAMRPVRRPRGVYGGGQTWD